MVTEVRPQCVGCGLNDGITVISGIICCVSAFHFDGGKAAAETESRVTDACHGIGDGHGGKAGATKESPVSNARHGIGDGHGGKVCTIIESPFSDARHGIGDDQVLDFLPFKI